MSESGSSHDVNPENPTPRKCFITRMEILFLIVVFMTETGCNISIDSTGGLQNALIGTYNLNAYQYSLFSSVYYIPTVIINGISGFLIDRLLGIKISTLVYSIVAVIGFIIFIAGGATSLFWLMLLGRLIFGLGNEISTGICVNYCIFAWYRNSIVNLASNLSINASVLGTLMIYEGGPRLFALFKETLPAKEALTYVLVIVGGTYIITSVFAVFMTYLKPKEVSSKSANELEEKIPTCKEITKFPLIFWLLCFLNFLVSFLLSFTQFSQGLLTSQIFNLTVNEASDAVTVMGLLKAILSIPLGLSVDLVGRNTWYVIASQIIGVTCHLCFVLKVTPYVCMGLYGVSNAMFNAAILPMFAYPLEKHLIGTCYGISSVSAGIATAAGPQVIGLIIDNYSYNGALFFYLGISIISLTCILTIRFLDQRSTGILSMAPKQRIEFEKQQETADVNNESGKNNQNYSSIANLTDNMMS